MSGVLGRALSAVTIAAAVLSSTTVGGPAAVAAAPAAVAAKIMVVGDSISQGLEGDFSWRYRLAGHLAANSTVADFVGPWTGTHVLPSAVGAPPARNGAYRPGIAFDSDHLAQWGWQMHQAKDVIAANVRTYQPDYLLVELGFNDLGWGVNGPAGLLDDFRTLVANARAARPGIRIVVANVVHRTPTGGSPNLPADITDYNNRLLAAVPGLSTAASPVHLADIDAPYDENRDAYDGLHPNVRGEYVIAKQFADVLFGRFLLGGLIGNVPATLPAALTVAAPATITATPVDDNIRVSWSHVFGAGGYQFFQRDATLGTPWQQGPVEIGADSVTADQLPAGHRMEFSVKTVRGTAQGQSAVASAVVRPLPAVPNVRTITGPDRPYAVTVSWDPVPGADDYHVYAAPGCDQVPPGRGEYRLVQWALGGRNSWTQELVLDACMNYLVAASRYSGESPLPDVGTRAWPYRNEPRHAQTR